MTPGYDQIGTVWLPLPHVLMLPFVRVDGLWQSGLAGAIPSGFCFVVAGSLLYASVRRVFQSDQAGWAAAALFALNPNMLYLQSIPMSEPVFLACWAGLLYSAVRFAEARRGIWAFTGGIAACLGTLTRYEGWFLLPFAGLWFLWAAGRKRVWLAVVFGALAALGPLYWLGHNWYLTGDALEFYRGPYSPRAIQKAAFYPGKENWRLAWMYYSTAATLCAGPVLAWMGAVGAVVALLRRAFWLVLMAALPGAFYIWSMHSSGGTPIFMPTLWPNSYYNTRYGIVVMPLLALGGAALVAAMPRWRAAAAAVLVVAASSYWAMHLQPRDWVVWEESRVNSQARRAWTAQTAGFLQSNYRAGTGVFTSFGDLAGVYRTAGIPFREAFTGDNGLPWLAAARRPGMWLWQQWAVAIAGDTVDRALENGKSGYELEAVIQTDGAPAVRVYRRRGGTHGTS